MGGSKPAAPEFAQSDSLILRLSRLSRRAFAVFGVGAGLPNVNTLFLLHILASCSRNHADERTSMILHRNRKHSSFAHRTEGGLCSHIIAR